jgi:hypothetical protein
MEREPVRRAAPRPALHLGERDGPLVQARLGARFPAYPAKEMDLALDVDALRRARKAP